MTGVVASQEDGHEPDSSRGVGLPHDLDLPLFAYGLLKPGELAYERVVGPHVVRSERAVLMQGALRYRDGLPLLDTTLDRAVEGVLLWFDDALAAYVQVGDFEPRKHYKWAMRAVAVEGDASINANVLEGRRPKRGSTGEAFATWTTADDPVLAFGPQVVTDVGLEVAVPPFPIRPPDSPEMWDRFFRLAGGYLLLWSLVERYAALAFGPSVDPGKRINLLDESSAFRGATRRAGVTPGQSVVDSRDPSSTTRIRDDGSGAARFWYAVRSNLSHRGKSAFQDGQLLRRSLIELHDTFKLTLIQEIPVLKNRWQERARQSGTQFVLLLGPEARAD